jgi:hypothetical protein
MVYASNGVSEVAVILCYGSSKGPGVDNTS